LRNKTVNVLPPSLSNSEVIVQRKAKPKIPIYGFMSNPTMAKRANYSHRNVTRLVQRRINDSMQFFLEDEDGHIWLRGDLEKEIERQYAEETTLSSTDSGIGSEIDFSEYREEQDHVEILKYEFLNSS
jgi:hypothetical protein